MPALYTHHLFALAFAKKHRSVFPFLLEKSSILTLGAQGPDPFFFYGQFPLRKRVAKAKVVGVGSQLHHQDPAPHLLTLIRQTFSMIQKKSSTTSILLTYLLGAISHYVLDRTMHPYVFYRSGFAKGGQLTPPYHADHADLEAKIDLAVIQHQSIKRETMSPKGTLKVSPQALAMISALYAQTYRTYPLTQTSYQDAVHDMLSVYAFIEDRWGFKKQLWKWIAGLRSVPVGLSHDQSLNDAQKTRVLNLDHQPWKHPASQVSHSETVLELFDHALSLMDRFIQLIQQGLQGNEVTLSDLESLIQGVNYDGHLFTDHMKTFVSIYPAYQQSPTQL